MRRALRHLQREKDKLGGRSWDGKQGSKRSNFLEIYRETEKSPETVPVKKEKKRSPGKVTL